VKSPLWKYIHQRAHRNLAVRKPNEYAKQLKGSKNFAGQLNYDFDFKTSHPTLARNSTADIEKS